MSRSQPKPKIIYKTLQQILKQNSHIKQPSLSNLPSKLSHPNIINQSSQPSIIPSSSKKNRYLSLSHNLTNNLSHQSQHQQNHQIYSKYYQQIYQIFHQLLNYFGQSKQIIHSQIKNVLSDKNIIKNKSIPPQIYQKIQDLKKMSNYIKHISRYFLGMQLTTLDNHPNILESATKKNSPTLSKKIVPLHDSSSQQSSTKLQTLSLKNSKIRSNRRIQQINTRKKSIYQMILQGQHNKIKFHHHSSRKKIL